MDTEKIKAIASLWPFAFLTFLTFFVLKFSKQLKGLFERLAKIKFKRGQTELTISQETKEAETKPEIQSEEKATSEKPATEINDKVPKLEPKTPVDWSVEMSKAFDARNMEEAEKAFKNMQELETNALQKLKNETLYSWKLYESGDTCALAKLQELAKKEEISSEAHYWIGMSYEKADDFEKAVEAFTISANGSQTETDRAPKVVASARCLSKAGKKQQACTTLMQEIGRVTDYEAKFTLYEGLALFYERAKDPELRALALEKALENRPNDTALRFRAAYSYSQNQLNAVSLLHYKTSLRFKPDDAATLNNIAVQYENLQMPLRAVKFYKKSFELNETLAGANLSFRFMNAGFAEEASNILDKAKQQAKLHPKVGSAISSLAQKEEAESKIEDSLINAAHEQQQFFLSFAEAYFVEKPNSSNFSGVWLFPDNIETAITQTGAQIEANWIRDRKKYKFTGNISNRGARITAYKMNYGLFNAELGFVNDDRGYAYLSPDGKQLFIMNLQGREHSFLTLVRTS